MSLYGQTDIRFPNLGIVIHNLPKGISIFGFDIAFYGIVIAIGMLAGFWIAERQSKKNGITSDVLMDFALVAIICAVIGARLYYVVFHWTSFQDEPLQIINLRTGGLAIYGGILAAVLTAVIFCRLRKVSFGALADTSVFGLMVGQMIGRWGNFFNREAFGRYTDGLFAMQVDITSVHSEFTSSPAYLSTVYEGRPEALHEILTIINNVKEVGGSLYYQVQPTYLYESLWLLLLLIGLLFFQKYKKFDGELIVLYMIGYGIGRFWIEGLRTDQLFLWNSTVPVSQFVSLFFVLIAIFILIGNYRKCWKRERESRKS